MTDDDLSTLTLTLRERLMLERALTVSLAMVDTLHGDTRDILPLWERVSEGLPEVSS